MSGLRVTLTYPAWKMAGIPETIDELARSRTAHLCALASKRTLSDLLRDAYAQGLHDVANIRDTWNGEPLRVRPQWTITDEAVSHAVAAFEASPSLPVKFRIRCAIAQALSHLSDAGDKSE